jgi:hypothetical protein
MGKEQIIVVLLGNFFFFFSFSQGAPAAAALRLWVQDNIDKFGVTYLNLSDAKAGHSFMKPFPPTGRGRDGHRGHYTAGQGRFPVMLS